MLELYYAKSTFLGSWGVQAACTHKLVISTVLALLTSWQNLVVGPSSADSANSVHGNFCRVQKANGIAKNKIENMSHKKLLLFFLHLKVDWFKALKSS